MRAFHTLLVSLTILATSLPAFATQEGAKKFEYQVTFALTASSFPATYGICMQYKE